MKMISVIGIGGTGCEIAQNLSKYPQYNIFEIDEDKNIQKYKTPEEYEKNCPDYTDIFSNLHDAVYIFLSACGNISGITLRLLEQLKEKKVSIVLIHSDESSLGKSSRLQQRTVMGVLQEYARSGLLENLYIISNSCIEPLLADVPLDKYYSALNDIICYTFNTVMWCGDNKPLLETREETDVISRICTFGLLDLEGNLTMLYPLQNITKERYYYNLTEKEIKTNLKLLQKIKSLTNTNELTAKTFAVYKTEHDQSICIVEAKTHIVQPPPQEK